MVAVLAVVMGAMGWVHHHARAHHAAGTAARVALTHPHDDAVAAAQRVAPDAEVAIERDGTWIIVRVTLAPGGPWPAVHAEVIARDQ